MQTRHSRVILITTNAWSPIASLLNANRATLEKLKNHHVLFSSAISPVPALLPATTSLMTGLYPYEHGVRLNQTHFLAFQYETLAELLRQKGYQTHAIVSSDHLSTRYQIQQGFQSYQLQEKPISFILQQASELLASSSKIFLWLHLSDFASDPQLSTENSQTKSENEQAFERFLQSLLDSDSSNTLLTLLQIPEDDFGVFPPTAPDSASTFSSFQSSALIYSATLPFHSFSFPISFVDLFPTLSFRFW
ncbi:MAG: sulfatase-like hydrolase/transferase [Planctomycetota bacterium]